jgi:protein phosphatase
MPNRSFVNSEPASPAPGLPSGQRIVLLIGLPGSGKSTWLAAQRIRPLSSDHLRELLADDINEQRFQVEIFAALRYLLRIRLDLGRAVTYIDATNLVREQRRPFLEIAAERGCSAEAVFFAVSLEVCQRRNVSRERRVPHDVMLKMAEALEPPSFEEGFGRILTIGPDGNEMRDEAVARAQMRPGV